MNQGPSDNQQLFISLCKEAIQSRNANQILVDFLNNVNLDELDFNAPVNGTSILCKLALDIANSHEYAPLEIILQKADLGTIDFNATVYYGALGELSLLWLICFSAIRSPNCINAIIARADLTKLDWNKKFGEGQASCCWMLAKTGNKQLIDSFLAKNIPGIDFTSKPASPADAKSAQQLINEAQNPPPAPVPAQQNRAFAPRAAAAHPAIVPAPPVPFGPSLFARLTSFSMYPKMTSFGVGLAVGLMALSYPWLIILGVSTLASIVTSAFIFLRNDYYENKLVRLPRVGAIQFQERHAFLEGEKAANSVSHYLLSYVKPLCWTASFGAGMLDELKDNHHNFHIKKLR